MIDDIESIVARRVEMMCSVVPSLSRESAERVVREWLAKYHQKDKIMNISLKKSISIDKTVAKVALTMMSGATRKEFRDSPGLTEDQALQIACNVIDAGVDCDETHVYKALALLKSKATIRQIKDAI